MTLVKIYVEIYESIVPRAAPLMEEEAFIFAFGTRQMIKKKAFYQKKLGLIVLK